MSRVPDTGQESLAQLESVPRTWLGEVRCMARLPILDQRGNVHGYELLFQDRPDGDIIANSVEASRTVLDDVVLFGLEKLTGGLPVFVNCTVEALTEQLVAVLPPSMTVLQIPQSLPMNPKLIAACRDLYQAGFRFALADFVWDAAPHPLIDLVKYIKVDFSHLDPLGHERLRQSMKGTQVIMMASQVHTQQAYKEARAEGFSLFQGVYFCNPEIVRSTKVPANRQSHIEILRQLFRDPLDLRTLCPLVQRDAALVYRVLRLVNSPICAIRQPVNSIEAAIVILGENTFRRIATLAIQCEINADQPPEILNVALLRARFCELAARSCGLDASEQYLVGMLSLLPAMLHVPMEAIAPELPLRPEICAALLGESTRERCLLGWIELHEKNLFADSYDLSQKFGINDASLHQFYVDALMWIPSSPGMSI